MRLSWRVALAALAVAPATLFALALPVVLGLPAWAAAGGLLLLLGLALAATLVAAAAHGRIATGVAALAVALTLVVHVRELWWEPQSGAAFAASIALLGAALFALGRRFAFPMAARARVAAAIASLLALGAAAPLAYAGSAEARWALLRHARVIGTPLFLVLGGDLEAAAAAAERGPVEPPPAAGEDLPAPALHAPGARSVVLIVIDTLRADALAPWGGSEPLPVCDELARSGVVLADVVASSSWTKPAVASLFTGLTPEEHGVRAIAHSLAGRHRTLAERFREAGYRTAAFSANVAQIHPAAGFAQGFDEFFVLESRRAAYARAGEVRARVERWLSGRDPAGAPFFLFVHFLDPHEPYLSGGTSALATPRLRRPAYRAEVRTLDRELGPLIASLRARLDDPVIVLTSDHGEELGDHGGAGHGVTLHREVVAVPVLLAGGGLARARIDARLEARDLYDLLPRFAAGEVDVAAWARGHARQLRRSSLHFRWPRMPFHRPYLRIAYGRRLEDARWVYLRSLYGDTRELYDRAADPLERRNLAGRHPGEVERLERLLEATEPRWSAPGLAHELGGVAAHLRSLGYL